MPYSIDLISPNGNLINASIFEASSRDFVVIIASATGVKQNFYEKIANYFVENEITVVTFDYSGIGNSAIKNIKLEQGDVYSWGKNDLGTIIEYCDSTYPKLKKVVVGHSIGGQIIGFTESSLKLDKVVLLCTQSGYWGHWNGFNKIIMWLNWNVLFPLLIKVYGYFPAKKISKMENLPKKVALEWTLWCNSKDYLFEHINENDLFFNKINCELISYSLGDDLYAPRKSVDWITSKFYNTKAKRIHLKPSDLSKKKIGHFGLFNEKCKIPFWIQLKNEIKQ